MNAAQRVAATLPPRPPTIPDLPPVTPLLGRLAGPKTPAWTAERILDAAFSKDGDRLLVHRGGRFFRWTGAAFAVVPPEEMEAIVYNFLNRPGTYFDTLRTPPRATRSQVRQVVWALKCATQIVDEAAGP